MTKARDIASAAPAPSTVSATEIGYLDGVSSAIQTQLDAKTAKSTLTTTGDIYYASSANTPARLGIGSTGNVLTVASGIPSWAAPASGVTFSGCSLYKSANQSISNATFTAVTFDSELKDTDNFHSTSSNTSRITIPAGKGGLYLITGQASFASNATGLRNAEIRKNGSSYFIFWVAPATNGDWSVGSVSNIIELAATDYIEMFVYQTSGGSLNINGGSTYGAAFQVQYLGA